MKGELKHFDGVTREQALRSFLASVARENGMMRERDELRQKLDAAQKALTAVEDVANACLRTGLAVNAAELARIAKKGIEESR